ncbi:hypothetical protein SESBI_06791 [Sesbania bispinosa]|nr:hypothetical protein SESBI_06791 [Sesbania bispinosa]
MTEENRINVRLTFGLETSEYFRLLSTIRGPLSLAKTPSAQIMMKKTNNGYHEI